MNAANKTFNILLIRFLVYPKEMKELEKDKEERLAFYDLPLSKLVINKNDESD